MPDTTIVKQLRRLVGAPNVFDDQTDLVTYAYDAAVLEPRLPVAVVRPGRSSLSATGKNCRLPCVARGPI